MFSNLGLLLVASATTGSEAGSLPVPAERLLNPSLHLNLHWCGDVV